MTAFRCFMMYDYSREFFFLFIRRGFSVSPIWNETRLQLEKILKEKKANPVSDFKYETTFGLFNCIYDRQAKCYFILLSNAEVIEEKQLATLSSIMHVIMQIPNYVKINKVEIETKYMKTIEEILDKCSISYEQEFGEVQPYIEPVRYNVEQPQSQTKISQSNKNIDQLLSKDENIKSNFQIKINQKENTSKYSFNIDELLLIFRCFMMYDYSRQFFFMFIRKGFPIDRTWSQERNMLEKEILSKFGQNDPKAKQTKAPESFNYKGTFGIYKAQYDEKAKCYFILLSRFGTPQQFQAQLLSSISDAVNKIDNYITIKYDKLEQQIKGDIEKIIDQNEQSVRLVVKSRFIDPILFEQKLQRQFVSEVSTNTKNLSSIVQCEPFQKKQQFSSTPLDLDDGYPQFTEINDDNEKLRLCQSKQVDDFNYKKQ